MLPLKDINSSRKSSILTYILVSINVIVFFVELSYGSNLPIFFQRFGFIPAKLTLFLRGESPSPYFWTIFTSMFVHGGWAHIISNMWYLIIFGDNVEDRMGKLGYLILYLTSGLSAALTQYLVAPFSKVPMVGASGAISGVLGAYLVLFPRARILALVPDPFTFGIFFRIVPISAFFFMFVWFGLQLLQGLAILPIAGKIGGVAFWAHIGGFIWGVNFALLSLLFKTNRHKEI